MESTTNDSLVGVGDAEFHVCPICGYAQADELPDPHHSARGYRCDFKGGFRPKYRLSHDFKTDVAKIMFLEGRAADLPTMLSMMYALLEGLCHEMGIGT